MSRSRRARPAPSRRPRLRPRRGRRRTRPRHGGVAGGLGGHGQLLSGRPPLRRTAPDRAAPANCTGVIRGLGRHSSTAGGRDAGPAHAAVRALSAVTSCGQRRCRPQRRLDRDAAPGRALRVARHDDPPVLPAAGPPPGPRRPAASGDLAALVRTRPTTLGRRGRRDRLALGRGDACRAALADLAGQRPAGAAALLDQAADALDDHARVAAHRAAVLEQAAADLPGRRGGPLGGRGRRRAAVSAPSPRAGRPPGRAARPAASRPARTTSPCSRATSPGRRSSSARSSPAPTSPGWSCSTPARPCWTRVGAAEAPTALVPAVHGPWRRRRRSPAGRWRSPARSRGGRRVRRGRRARTSDLAGACVRSWPG